VPSFLERVVAIAPTLSLPNQLAIAEVVIELRGAQSVLLLPFIGADATPEVREAVQRVLAKFL